MNNNIEKIIMENMLAGILLIEENGNITYANPAAMKILNVKADEIVGGKLGPLFLLSEKNDDFVQIILDAFATLEHAFQSVVTFENGNGVKYLKVIAKAEIKDSSGAKNIVVTVCLQDVSEYVIVSHMEKTVKELKQQNNELNIRNKLIRKIFGSFIVRSNGADILDLAMLHKLKQGIIKNVTVMQSDLRGYTAMSAMTKPDEMLLIMNYYVTAMTEIILAHHGTIVELLGDGIVSAFGAFGNEEQQCEEAVAAAIEMQSRMVEVNEWVQKHKFNVHLKMGIGIDCGEAVIGMVGSEKKRAFDVMGKVVTTADDIQGNTVEGDILISPTVRQGINCGLGVARKLQIDLPHTGENITAYKVKSLGAPYNIMCPEISAQWKKLRQPVNIEFYEIAGKVRNDRRLTGQILEISQTALQLSSEQELTLLGNFEVKINSFSSSLYIKITERKGEKYLASITAVPPEYEAWVRNISSDA